MVMPIPHKVPHGATNPRGNFVALFLMWRLMKEKLYGYMMIDELNSLGIGGCGQATVYTLLWKMEQMGFVKAEQKMIANRPRRMYSITQKGRKFFEDIKTRKIRGALKEFIRDLAH
jgi:PadR family transcriptional regulator PadR